jgi:hypothetical protein
MSASGPKRTSLVALHMSAFGGKADMNFFGNPRSRSLLGVKRTCAIAMHMSAFDPKRTLAGVLCCSAKRVSALSKHLLEPVRCSLLGSWRVAR